VVKNIRSSWRFGDDRDTEIDLARLAITHPVEADHLAGCRIQADLQALDLAQPTVELGFLNPILQIGDDLGQAGPGTGIQPKARASYAEILMFAWCPVWTTAFAKLQFAGLEVCLEFSPFLLGRLAVLSFGTNGSSAV
jgi:hypothetical protein